MAKPGKRKDCIAVTVPFKATWALQASRAAETPGEARPSIAAWAHPTVWTTRMLAALQRGVKGGKWHALNDKVYDRLNLFMSARKVLDKKGAAGVDRQTVEDFAEHERQELQNLQTRLREDTYRPAAVRRVWIPKPGGAEKRPLGIPTVRDRVVQTALVHVIEPILDNEFHEQSYGFRHGRSCHDALRRVEELLEAGYVYVVDADLKSYFDTIPKDRLLDLVQQKLRFPRAKSHQKLVDRIRELTPRKSRQSLDCMIQRLNRMLAGWFNYFRHCIWSIFEEYDSMIRRRLRRMLVKRHRKNPKRLTRNQRWPNAFFAKHGLYSLRQAHNRFVQSLEGNY